MRRSPVALAPMAAALVVAACVGDRDGTASRLNAPQTSLASGGPNACDFTTMKSDARAFLASSKDTIFSIMSDMQTAYKANGATGATTKGFDILAQIAAKRLTAAQGGLPADGGRLVTDIVAPACTDIEKNLPSGTLTEFDPTSALTNGIFEVRGGASALAAVARVSDATSSTGRSEPTPRWGVEPASPPCTSDGQCTWPASGRSDNRYLLFAYPTDVNLQGETATGGGAFSGKDGFTIGMMPDISDKKVFTVGACIPVTNPASPGTFNLLVHATSAFEIFGNSSPQFCSTPVQASLGIKTWFASLSHRTMSLFSATPLFAETDPLDGRFVGGGPSSWSPISSTNLIANGISLQFGAMPKNGVAGGQLQFTVHAASAPTSTSPNGHGVGGVTITISIANNSGAPAGAVVVAGNTPLSLTTGPTGDVSFSVMVNKAGGYTFTANGVLGASSTQTGTSKLFNVKNH